MVAAKGAFDILNASDWNDLILAVNPVGAVAARVAVQSLANNSETAISLDTEIFDNGGMFAPTATVITAVTSGLYRVSGYVEIAASNVGIRSLVIYQNGVAIVASATNAPTSFSARLNVAGDFSATIGDTFDIRAYQDSGSSKNITGRLGVVRSSGG